MISGRTIQAEVEWANQPDYPGQTWARPNYPMERIPGEFSSGTRKGAYALNIYPFNPDQINPNSYNVTLGDTIATYPENIANWLILNENFKGGLWRDTGYIHDWEQLLSRDMRAQIRSEYPMPQVLDTKDEPSLLKTTIPPDGITLFPGILYLGHTVERTKCHGLVPQLDGRSSVARLGITVHQTAGFGDNGFDGQWTFEITVAFPVRIYAGSQIAQVSFTPISGVQGPWYEGKYAGQVGQVKSGWWKEVSQLGKKCDTE